MTQLFSHTFEHFTMMSNFYQLLLNLSQDLNFFIGLVIGLEHKGRACKMCESVWQKLGHTSKLATCNILNVQINEYWECCVDCWGLAKLSIFILICVCLPLIMLWMFKLMNTEKEVLTVGVLQSCHFIFTACTLNNLFYF